MTSIAAKPIRPTPPPAATVALTRLRIRKETNGAATAFIKLGLTTLLVLGLCQRASAAAELAAMVDFQDGTQIYGSCRLMGSAPLVFVPNSTGKQQQVRLVDLVQIDHVPETAAMTKPWAFKESGRAEKIYFDGEYPLLNFVTTLTMSDGSQLQGHIISCVLLVTTPEQRHKILLKRQIRGEPGQQLDAVIYPTRIRFPNNPVQQAKQLRGTVTELGELQQVRALDVERAQVVSARIEGNRFDFGNVLPGVYDVFILTDRCVLAGISNATPGTHTVAEAITTTDEQAIAQCLPLVDDFFADRWIVRVTGNHKFAKTLVYKRRAKFYASEQLTPGGYLWHLDIWQWHRADQQWKIDDRWILTRRRQHGGEAIRRLLLVPELQAVPAGSDLELHSPEDSHANWQFIRNLD